MVNLKVKGQSTIVVCIDVWGIFMDAIECVKIKVIDKMRAGDDRSFCCKDK